MMPVEHAVRRSVLGFGPRPRLLYRLPDGTERVAIGRRGEPLASLLDYILQTYPGKVIPLQAEGHGEVAAYVAGWMRAGEAAKAVGIRKATLLEMARDPQTVARSVLFDADLHSRLWAADVELVPDGFDVARTVPVNSDTHGRKHPWGIGKTERTGEYTTRGKPKLRYIGRELSFRGQQLRLYPGIPLRWTQEQLIGLPVHPEWWTKNRQIGNQKDDLQPPCIEDKKPQPALRFKRRKRRESWEPMNDWCFARGPEFDFQSEFAKAA